MFLRLALRSIVLFIAAFTLSAFGDGRWMIHGPDGGDVTRLLFDPGDPSIVYATADNGLFRSTDGGRHWLGAAELLGTTMLDVAVAKSDPRIVFAASPYGLFKSTDRGLHWSLIQSSGVFSLAVSAQNPDVVYCVSFAGPVRSADGGVTFGPRGSGLAAGNPGTVVVDPQHDSVVYAAFSSAAGVYKSTDGGAHWAQASSGLAAPQVFSLAVDPANSATLYAGGSASTIYKSTDGAASWTALTTGYSGLICSELTVSPSTVLAATSRGALLSQDGGATWSRGDGIVDTNTTAVAIADATTFLAATPIHVYRTNDGGATGVLSESGLTSFITQAIAADPHDDAVIYAAGPAGLARSADHGLTWSLSTAITASKLAIDTNASTLYAVSNTVERSIDSGNTWTSFDSGLPAVRPSFIASDPRLSGTIYAIVNGAVYKKAGDDPWLSRNSGLPDSLDFVTVDPHSSSIVYAGGPAGVFKSSNGGESWTPANAGLTGFNSVGLAVDPFDARHLFAWSPTQAFESIDAAATWSLRSGLRGEIVFDPSAAGVVLSNTFNDVQRSSDGGKTWSSLGQGLPKTHSFLAAGANGTLYLGSSSGGVFVFTVVRRRTAGK